MKSIPGYEGFYSAEEDGRIWSHISKKYLSSKHKRYAKVELCRDGIHKSVSVHRLIALTFIPNPDNKPTIDHIDRNKQNNNVSNLRWATPAEQSSNLGTYNTNTSGHKNVRLHHYIALTGEVSVYYVFHICRKGIYHNKSFKTLEEATKYRDEYLLCL